MMLSEVFIPRLTEVLERNFEDQEYEDDANELYDEWALADAMQRFSRGDKLPSQDKEKLITAAKQIEQAAENIQKVGWHGDKSLAPLAAKIASGEQNICDQKLINVMSSVFFLADYLTDIAAELRAASDKVDIDGGSFWAALGGEGPAPPSRGRPPETAARYVAEKCAEIYFRNTGKQPSVVTPIDGGPASGPFLNFVTEVFQAFKIKASAEASARKVSMEKNANS